MRAVKSTAPQLCQICKGEFKASKVKVIENNNGIYTFCEDCIDFVVLYYAKNRELID